MPSWAFRWAAISRSKFFVRRLNGFTRLALLDTNAQPDSPETTETRRRRIEQTRAGKFGLVVEQSFAGTVHPDNASDSRLYSIHRAMSAASGAEAYIRHQEAIITRPDSRPLLADIRVPTLVLLGEGDTISPLTMAEDMHRGIAGSTLTVIPRAGHMALLEQPELVNTALKTWAQR